MAPGRYGSTNTCALPELSLGEQRIARSPTWICRQATLVAGVAGGPQASGATVALTMSTPETCTTCGEESVKEHGGGGGCACAVPNPAAADTVVVATARTRPRRVIPHDKSATNSPVSLCPY